MAKLRDLITEREFGEPLPTFKDVMEKHQINKLKEDWWSDMDAAAQAQYIKDHPGSQQAQNAADDEADDMDRDARFAADAEDEPKVPAPDSRSDTGKPRVSANPYDDNYGQEVDDEESSGRTGKELNQETLTVDGKQYRRISESVEKQPKPKHEFSEFYQRFKR